MAERPLIIYGFDTSNNLKVRLALAYKSIPYEFRTIEPDDRAELVRVSGQHLTPAMLHGETVLFDSGAILRYLDANFPETPKLFGTSRAEQWEIEDWERFGRGALAEPLMSLVHARVNGREVTAAMKESATRDLAGAVGRLESRLSDREWLAGDRLSAADITCAAVGYRIQSKGILPWPNAPRTQSLITRILALLPA